MTGSQSISIPARPWSRYFLTVLCLGALLFGVSCREETWDPEVVALVDGRPVAKTAVDRVLEWGFYTHLGGDQSENAAAMTRVIDALIDEELILAEARRAGLGVSAAEVETAFQAFEASWFGRRPLAAEAAELRQALRKQLILRKMTERVMDERRSLAPDDWRDFWDRWPKESLPRYQVRVLLTPPAQEAPAGPRRKGESLDQLAARLENEGLAVIVSDPLWLRGDLLEPGLAEALAQAREGNRLTEPYRQAESWAIYEVSAAQPAPGPDEEFKAAKSAFEAQAGEAAFQQWLDEKRGQAEIKLNPAYSF